MKTSLSISVLLSTAFCTNLLSPPMPVSLAARYDAGTATMAGRVRTCDRSPIDKYLPDAAMIKSGKTHAKTVKL